MIEQIFILVLITFAIWWTFKQGEIFGFVQSLFAPLPRGLKKPLFDCPVCMHFWYGTLFYWLLYGNPFTSAWHHWLTVVVCGVGVCAIIVKLAPCCDDE